MKKLGSLLLAGLFTASISACGQESSITALQDVQPQKVATYSNVGLKTMFSAMVSSVYKVVDKNKDRALSLDEYKLLFSSVTPGVPAPSQPSEPVNSEPLPAEPVAPPVVQDPATPTPSTNTDQSANQIQALSQKVSIPADPTARFKKMDKNKNGKLTISEVNALPSYFMPGQKAMIREAAKKQFEIFDLNKNKSISRDEFFKINMAGNSQSALNLQGMLFITADINNTNSLGFSEFEDVFYSSYRTYLAGTPNTPIAPAPTDPVAPPPSDPVPSEPVPVSPPSQDPVAPPNEVPAQP